ncbi:MAG: flagellar hook assembly protein FlgD [Candidatus Midichloria sp.]
MEIDIKSRVQNEKPKIAPASSKKRSVQELKSDMMRLLIASFRNVNPLQQTDPTTSMNMVSTIIALEQGEAQVMTMERLEKIIQSADNIGNYSHLFGKGILIGGDKVVVQGGKALLNFEIKEEAKNPILEIIDAAGDVVFTEAIKNSDTKFTWNGIPGKSEDFYKGLKFRIIDEFDVEKKDVANMKAYYTYVDEITQEGEDSKRIRYLLTKCGNKVALEQVQALRYDPSTQSASLNTLLEADINKLLQGNLNNLLNSTVGAG